MGHFPFLCFPFSVPLSTVFSLDKIWSNWFSSFVIYSVIAMIGLCFCSAVRLFVSVAVSQGRDMRVCVWDLSEDRSTVTDSLLTGSVGFSQCSLLESRPGSALLAHPTEHMEEVSDCRDNSFITHISGQCLQTLRNKFSSLRGTVINNWILASDQ